MLMDKHQNYVHVDVNVECCVVLKLKRDESIVKSFKSFVVQTVRKT